MGELTKALEELAGRAAPPSESVDPILRRLDERRRRRRLGGLVVGLTTTVALVVGVAVFATGGGPSPAPGSSPSPTPTAGESQGRVYHDPAGWSLTVPRGWAVLPFRSSSDGVESSGAQISNVALPEPNVVRWAPPQADGRTLPATGVALVVGTQSGGGRGPSGPVPDLPLEYPDGWSQGSAFAGAPTLDSIWFRGGDSLFVATVKTGPDVAPADRDALRRMVRSIRFNGGPAWSPTASSGLQTPLWAEIDLPSTTMSAGTSMSGYVVVHNDTGQELHVSGCGTPFAVALGNDEIEPTVAWNSCLQPFTIPSGTSNWPVTVRATFLACGGPSPVPACQEGHVPPLPPGSYRAMLYQSPRIVPTPPSIDVQVTP
jgi:hypothetical protein